MSTTALVVPGLIVLARWSLLVPVIVLEGERVRAAIGRSSALVRGRTAPVLAVMPVSVGLDAGVTLGLDQSVLADVSAWVYAVGSWGVYLLITPHLAHVLGVLYYRLAQPERPLPAA